MRHLISHERCHGKSCIELSSSPLNLPRHGFETAYDALRDLTSCHTLGISTCHVGAPDFEAAHMIEGTSAAGSVFEEVSSRNLLTFAELIYKFLLVFVWEELEKLHERVEENLRIAIFKIRTGQKIRTDHL